MITSQPGKEKDIYIENPIHDFGLSETAHKEKTGYLMHEIGILSLQARLEPSPDHDFPINFYHIQFEINSDQKTRITSDQSSSPFKINEFLSVFPHPGTKIHWLTLKFETPPTVITNRMFKGFMSAMKTVQPVLKFQVKVVELIIDGGYKSDEFEIFLTVWNLINHNSLRKLKISGNGFKISEILGTRQWNTLKELESNLAINENVEIEHFGNFERMTALFERCSMTQFLKLVQSFRERQIRIGCYFQVTSTNKLDFHGAYEFVFYKTMLTRPVRYKREESNIQMIFFTDFCDTMLKVSIELRDNLTIYRCDIVERDPDIKEEMTDAEEVGCVLGFLCECFKCFIRMG